MNKVWKIWWMSLLLMVVCGAAAGFVMAEIDLTKSQVSERLNYQGTLTNGAGVALTGPQDLTFTFYDGTGTGATVLWTEAHPAVFLDDNGHFSVTLGTIIPITESHLGDNGQTFIGIRVESESELPRQQLTSVAYSLKAGDGVPKGGIIMWSGAVDVVPYGWVLCDGSDGTPDLRNRFVLGAGDRFDSGDADGEEAHVLIVSEMPSHKHSASTNPTGAHTHGMTNRTSQNQSGASGMTGVYTRTGLSTYNTETAGIHSHTVTVDNKGGGVAHNNMPPYYALAFIMKL